MNKEIIAEGQIWGSDMLIHRGRGSPLLDEEDIKQKVWELLHKYQGKNIRILIEEIE